jgi:hypothetical protein
MGEKRVVFLTHNIADLLTASDESFCTKTENFINNLLNKAVLISATGEKERSRFFNQMTQKIKEVREKIR